MIVSPAKTAEPIEMSFGVWSRVGPRNHVLDGGPDLRGKGQFWGRKGRPIVKYSDHLPWAVQKRLNWSRFCLGYALGLAQGSMCYMEVHISTTWRIQLKHPCAAAICAFFSNYFDHLLPIAVIRVYTRKVKVSPTYVFFCGTFTIPTQCKTFLSWRRSVSYGFYFAMFTSFWLCYSKMLQ